MAGCKWRGGEKLAYCAMLQKRGAQPPPLTHHVAEQLVIEGMPSVYANERNVCKPVLYTCFCPRIQIRRVDSVQSLRPTTYYGGVATERFVADSGESSFVARELGSRATTLFDRHATWCAIRH
jgi:hypothetical protein